MPATVQTHIFIARTSWIDKNLQNGAIINKPLSRFGSNSWNRTVFWHMGIAFRQRIVKMVTFYFIRLKQGQLFLHVAR